MEVLASLTVGIGGGLPPDGDEISDGAAEDMAAATATAATELGAVLATMQQLDAWSAQAVTNGISSLSGLMAASDGSPSSAGAAESISTAVDQLARAATVGVLAAATYGVVSNGTYGIAEPVVLSSPNLNMSINLRNASALASMPIECDASTGVAAAVAMPADLIGGLPGLDPWLPVAAILHVSRVNLHGGLVGHGAAERRRRSLRRRLTSEPTSVPAGPPLCSNTCIFAYDAECDDGGAGAEYSLDCAYGTDCEDCGPRATSVGRGGDGDDDGDDGMAAGPVISFKLMQRDVELVVNHAATPINISLAYQSPAAAAGRSPCVGRPDSLSDAARACATTVECRFWNKTVGNWSTAGCSTTMGADGSVGCSCTHLTEFIAFEFPTTVEQLRETLLESVAFVSLELRALECALDPARSWVTVRPIWDCLFGLVFTLTVMLIYAVRNDRREMHDTLALLAGKKKDEMRKRQANMSQAKMKLKMQPMVQMQTTTKQKKKRTGRILPQMGAPRMMPRPKRATLLTCGDGAPASAHVSPPPLPTADVVVLSTTTMDEVTYIRPFQQPGQAATTIQQRWKQAHAKQQAHLQVEAITQLWHKDVNAVWKRLCLACRTNHSLCAGILTRGVAGYTRAQTMMMLYNGFAFELVMLCLLYESSSPPTPLAEDNVTGLPLEEVGPAVVINLVSIVFSATVAAIICIPAGLIIGWVFDPIILVNVSKNLLWLILCWPYWLVWKCLLKRHWNRSSFVVAPAPQSCSSTVVDIRMRQAALAQQNAVDQTLVFDLDTEDIAQGSPSPPPSPPSRAYSYASLDEGLLKKSLTYTWKNKDWASVRKILLGWTLSLMLFGIMCFIILSYGCQLFEPYQAEDHEDEGSGESSRRLTQKRVRAGDEADGDDQGQGDEDGGGARVRRTIPLVRQAGNPDALIIAWLISCIQRFVLFEPTLILANKGLPMLFSSVFCATCCGEAIVESLSLLITILAEAIKSIKS
jgi:hypothetical protein